MAGTPVVKAVQDRHTGDAHFPIKRYRWKIGLEVSTLTYPTPRLARAAGRKHLEKNNNG